MKILRIDWAVFLGFLEPWEGLAPRARRILLEAKPKAVMPASTLGDELEALLAGGFLRTLADGERVQISEDFHETHKVLRSLARHPLLQHPDPQTLREYVGEHFTSEERRALDDSPHWDRDARLLETITSVGHVRGFLQAQDRRGWENERLPERGWSSEQAWTQVEPLLAGKHAGADAAALLELLAAAQGPVPFRVLSERLGKLSRARLAHALEVGLRYLLAFPAFDAQLVPALMLWPSIAARLTRVPAPPPPIVLPEDSFCVALRLEDLTQLLVRAAEPMRVKSNGWSLFSAVERELEQGLLPLPTWLLHARLFPENAPGERVKEALSVAQRLGFLARTGKSGRDLSLATTPEGWKWLDLGPRERLRKVLELYRPRPKEARGRTNRARKKHAPGREEVLFDELGAEIEAMEALLDEPSADEFAPFATHDSRSEILSDLTLFGTYTSHGLAEAAIGAFARLEPGRAVPFGAFLRHQAEGSNPFLEQAGAKALGYALHGRPLAEEQLEELWISGLQRILHRYLLPFGGVRTGITSEDGLTLELNDVGRYVLALSDDFTLDAAPPSKSPVRVQPDFEVVFVAASPALEAALSRFAERRGTGVGVLFRITRASILQAAQAGLGADEVLATLTRASTTPVPANVAHEIRAWFAGCRRLCLESVQLVRCPDAATASRVLAAAGAGKLEPLSETVLVLADPAHKAAVTRALRKAGLFLTSEVRPSAKSRAQTRWRR